MATQAADFVGYLYTSSEWARVTCAPGYVYDVDKPSGLNNPGYGECCTTTSTSCYPWTACDSGTLYFSGGSSSCQPGFSCATWIVASSLGAESDGDRLVVCATGSTLLLYRTPPSALTLSSVSITNSMSNSATTTIYHSISSATNSGPTTTTNITTATQTTSPSNRKPSGAAIAGTVVGPICGVALILGLVFLCLRHRRSKPPAAAVSPASWPPPSGPIAPFGDYRRLTPKPNAVNAPNSHHPVRIPPAYPGAGNVEPVVALNGMPLPTMSHGTAVAAHSPVPIGLQSEAQVQQQIQRQQAPARRPVVAGLGMNPPVRGVPPGMPVNTGYFGSNV